MEISTAIAPQTAPGSPTSSEPSPGAGPSIYRFSVEQYLEMGRTGILTKDDRVELIEGWIVRKMTKNLPHSFASSALQDLLGAIVPGGWYLRIEQPIALVDGMPEPDLLVAKGSRRTYLTRNPNASDTVLIVEVADSSLDRDRVYKKRAYARAGIVCYWLVDLVHSVVEVHTEPSGPTTSPDYAKMERVEADGTLVLRIEGREIGRIAVRDVLP